MLKFLPCALLQMIVALGFYTYSLLYFHIAYLNCYFCYDIKSSVMQNDHMGKLEQMRIYVYEIFADKSPLSNKEKKFVLNT